jgi:hypothetical protein
MYWFENTWYNLIGWRFSYSQWELYHTNKDENSGKLIEVYKKVRHRDYKPKYKRIVTKLN